MNIIISSDSEQATLLLTNVSMLM